jgi:regulator of replication initiation timing
MFDVLLAGPRQVVRGARRLLTATLEVVESVPRMASALDDIRATLHHIERLAAYVAEELPELIYQLEQLRARLDDADETDEREEEAVLTPRSPRTG